MTTLGEHLGLEQPGCDSLSTFLSDRAQSRSDLTELSETKLVELQGLIDSLKQEVDGALAAVRQCRWIASGGFLGVSWAGTMQCACPHASCFVLRQENTRSGSFKICLLTTSRRLHEVLDCRGAAQPAGLADRVLHVRFLQGRVPGIVQQRQSHQIRHSAGRRRDNFPTSQRWCLRWREAGGRAAGPVQRSKLHSHLTRSLH